MHISEPSSHSWLVGRQLRAAPTTHRDGYGWWQPLELLPSSWDHPTSADSEDSCAPQTRTPYHNCIPYLQDLAAKRALGEGTAFSERCLNPKEADSKLGTSGTDEVVVSGDLRGWGAQGLCQPVPTIVWPGWLPSSTGHEVGRSHLSMQISFH